MTTSTTVWLTYAVVPAGQANTAHATVTSSAGAPSGTVTFTVPGYVSGEVTLVDGTASFALPTDLYIGTYEVNATYNGGGNGHKSPKKAVCFLPSASTTYVEVR